MKLRILPTAAKKLLGSSGGQKLPSAGKDSLPREGDFRVGLWGPSAAGKTVFFTMLYDYSQKDPRLNVAPRDAETSIHLFENLASLRHGEWLPPTIVEQPLNFMGSVRGGAKIPISTYDYAGEWAQPRLNDSKSAELLKSFLGCNALLIMIPPETIRNPAVLEQHLQMPQLLINQVYEQRKRLGRKSLPPMGIVISKADSLPGFAWGGQTVVIPSARAYLKARPFPDLVKGILSQPNYAESPKLQSELEGILYALRGFIEQMAIHGVDYQLFLVSSVGSVRKVRREDGTTVELPPLKAQAIGIQEPFLWIIGLLRRRMRLARFSQFVNAVQVILAISLVLLTGIYAWFLVPRVRLPDPIATPSQEFREAKKDADRFASFRIFAIVPGGLIGEEASGGERLYSHARYTAAARWAIASLTDPETVAADSTFRQALSDTASYLYRAGVDWRGLQAYADCINGGNGECSPPDLLSSDLAVKTYKWDVSEAAQAQSEMKQGGESVARFRKLARDLALEIHTYCQGNDLPTYEMLLRLRARTEDVQSEGRRLGLGDDSRPCSPREFDSLVIGLNPAESPERRYRELRKFAGASRTCEVLSCLRESAKRECTRLWPRYFFDKAREQCDPQNVLDPDWILSAAPSEASQPENKRGLDLRLQKALDDFLVRVGTSENMDVKVDRLAAGLVVKPWMGNGWGGASHEGQSFRITFRADQPMFLCGIARGDETPAEIDTVTVGDTVISRMFTTNTQQTGVIGRFKLDGLEDHLRWMLAPLADASRRTE